MQTHIDKYGYILAVKIPEPLTAQSDLPQIVWVETTTANGKVVLKPTVRPTLELLLAGVTDENLHQAVDFGGPCGQEEL